LPGGAVFSPTFLTPLGFDDYPFEVSLQVPGRYSNWEADYERSKCHTEKGFRSAPLVRSLRGEIYLTGLNEEPELQADDTVKICLTTCKKGLSLNPMVWGKSLKE
jgi:hypothetical protein